MWSGVKTLCLEKGHTFNVRLINNSNVVWNFFFFFKDLLFLWKCWLGVKRPLLLEMFIVKYCLLTDWLDFNIFCVFVCVLGFVCGLLEKASGPPSSSMWTPLPPHFLIFLSVGKMRQINHWISVTPSSGSPSSACCVVLFHPQLVSHLHPLIFFIATHPNSQAWWETAVTHLVQHVTFGQIWTVSTAGDWTLIRTVMYHLAVLHLPS